MAGGSKALSKHMAQGLIACLAIIAAGSLWRGCPAERQQAAAVQAAEGAAQEAMDTAARIEATAIEARPKVEQARQAVMAAMEHRTDAEDILSRLPKEARDEMEALRGLVDALEAQLALEAARGDAWKESALASMELARALREANKAARRQGFRAGALTGAAAVVLVFVLL